MIPFTILIIPDPYFKEALTGNLQFGTLPTVYVVAPGQAGMTLALVLWHARSPIPMGCDTLARTINRLDRGGSFHIPASINVDDVWNLEDILWLATAASSSKVGEPLYLDERNNPISGEDLETS